MLRCQRSALAGIVARSGVEVREALVRFATLLGGGRGARLREELVGEARGFAREELDALERDAREPRALAVGVGGARGGKRGSGLAVALVLVRGLDEKEIARADRSRSSHAIRATLRGP